MNYYFGEIVITHKKTWFGWFEFNQVFTQMLVTGKDWLEAKEKFTKYAEDRMRGFPNYRYSAFVISPL